MPQTEVPVTHGPFPPIIALIGAEVFIIPSGDRTGPDPRADTEKFIEMMDPGTDTSSLSFEEIGCLAINNMIRAADMLDEGGQEGGWIWEAIDAIILGKMEDAAVKKFNAVASLLDSESAAGAVFPLKEIGKRVRGVTE